MVSPRLSCGVLSLVCSSSMSSALTSSFSSSLMHVSMSVPADSRSVAILHARLSFPVIYCPVLNCNLPCTSPSLCCCSFHARARLSSVRPPVLVHLCPSAFSVSVSVVFGSMIVKYAVLYLATSLLTCAASSAISALMVSMRHVCRMYSSSFAASSPRFTLVSSPFVNCVTNVDATYMYTSVRS